jgi:acetyl-CoA C-acetyltransferase
LTINAALSAANVSLDDIAFFDFYSCFPVAVANAIEAVGLAANDSRGLTLTGGLPYFGGPGNNYSMHAIVEVVDRLRKGQGRYGMVAANGGFLSKYAVGIYSTLAENFNHCDSAAVQAEVDALSSPTFNRSPEGEGRIETYTLSYDREGNAKSAVIVGRLNTTNERFIAMTPKGNREIAEALATCEPLGLSVSVVTDAHVNYFQLMNESE